MAIFCIILAVKHLNKLELSFELSLKENKVSFKRLKIIRVTYICPILIFSVVNKIKTYKLFPVIASIMTNSDHGGRVFIFSGKLANNIISEAPGK